MLLKKGTKESKVVVLTQPLVIFSKLAINKMRAYTELCHLEIGWLFSIARDKNTFYVQDSYLFEQQVHATTTEISADGLAKFAEELLQRDDGVEVWNSIRGWGHSHVNMGITPSGQDDSQMKVFGESGNKWFLRLIMNKRGELSIDLFDYEQGVVFHNIEWKIEEEVTNPRLKEIEKEIKALEKEHSTLLNTCYETLKAEIKPEYDAKVKPFTYQYQNFPQYGANVGGLLGGASLFQTKRHNDLVELVKKAIKKESIIEMQESKIINTYQKSVKTILAQHTHVVYSWVEICAAIHEVDYSKKNEVITRAELEKIITTKVSVRLMMETESAYIDWNQNQIKKLLSEVIAEIKRYTHKEVPHKEVEKFLEGMYFYG